MNEYVGNHTFVFFFDIVDDKVVNKENSFGIHRNKDVIFKLRYETTLNDRFWIWNASHEHLRSFI